MDKQLKKYECRRSDQPKDGLLIICAVSREDAIELYKAYESTTDDPYSTYELLCVRGVLYNYGFCR